MDELTIMLARSIDCKIAQNSDNRKLIFVEPKHNVFRKLWKNKTFFRLVYKHIFQIQYDSSPLNTLCLELTCDRE